MGKYLDSTSWSDVVPIPQDDGGPNALALIAYTDAYSEAMSYLRAVMAQDEKSERVLGLTEDIIKMNPAHYTVWLYRVDTLLELKKDFKAELKWLDSIALKNLKNYQIWHHRQTVMTQLQELPASEMSFLNSMFAKDAKNYHVWSYRQWLVRHYSCWASELSFIERLLNEDVRNNSAWNHRWFVVFGQHVNPSKQSIREPEVFAMVESTVFDREIEYTKTKILLAPQNQSPWNYLKAIIKQQGRKAVVLQNFAETFVTLGSDEAVASSHALELLVDIYAEEKEIEKSFQALDLLSEKYDPIRKNFWAFKKSQLSMLAVAS